MTKSWELVGKKHRDNQHDMWLHAGFFWSNESNSVGWCCQACSLDDMLLWSKMATGHPFFNTSLMAIYKAFSCDIHLYYLVGGLEHFLFFHILGMSSFQLMNSYFSEGLVAQPPTRLRLKLCFFCRLAMFDLSKQCPKVLTPRSLRNWLLTLRTNGWKWGD